MRHGLRGMDALNRGHDYKLYKNRNNNNVRARPTCSLNVWLMNVTVCLQAYVYRNRHFRGYIFIQANCHIGR